MSFEKGIPGKSAYSLNHQCPGRGDRKTGQVKIVLKEEDAMIPQNEAAPQISITNVENNISNYQNNSDESQVYL